MKTVVVFQAGIAMFIVHVNVSSWVLTSDCIVQSSSSDLSSKIYLHPTEILDQYSICIVPNANNFIPETFLKIEVVLDLRGPTLPLPLKTPVTSSAVKT